MSAINYYQKIEFNNETNNYFDGAITYLQTIYGTDLVSKNIIKINVMNPGNAFQNIPVTKRDDNNTNINNYYYSTDEEFSYYEIDLLNKSFHLESYSIRCNQQDFFSQWEIQGSNDGIHYTTVDYVEDFEEPTQEHHSQHVICKYPQTVRYIKYQTKDKRFGGDFVLYLYRIEFFGYFVPQIKQKCTCVNSFQFISLYAFLIIILVCFEF